MGTQFGGTPMHIGYDPIAMQVMGMYEPFNQNVARMDHDLRQNLGYGIQELQASMSGAQMPAAANADVYTPRYANSRGGSVAPRDNGGSLIGDLAEFGLVSGALAEAGIGAKALYDGRQALKAGGRFGPAAFNSAAASHKIPSDFFLRTEHFTRSAINEGLAHSAAYWEQEAARTGDPAATQRAQNMRAEIERNVAESRGARVTPVNTTSTPTASTSTAASARPATMNATYSGLEQLDDVARSSTAAGSPNGMRATYNGLEQLDDVARSSNAASNPTLATQTSAKPTVTTSSPVGTSGAQVVDDFARHLTPEELAHYNSLGPNQKTAYRGMLGRDKAFQARIAPAQASAPTVASTATQVADDFARHLTPEELAHYNSLGPNQKTAYRGMLGRDKAFQARIASAQTPAPTVASPTANTTPTTSAARAAGNVAAESDGLFSKTWNRIKSVGSSAWNAVKKGGKALGKAMGKNAVGRFLLKVAAPVAGAIGSALALPEVAAGLAILGTAWTLYSVGEIFVNAFRDDQAQA